MSIRPDSWLCPLLVVAIGYMLCQLAHAAFVWTTKLLEFQLESVWEPDYASLIVVHVVQWSMPEVYIGFLANVPWAELPSVTAVSYLRAADKKCDKYTALVPVYSFVPLAFETLGPMNSAGSAFIDEIGNRTRSVTGDVRATSFLWQRLSMAVQCYNSICLLGTFATHQDG